MPKADMVTVLAGDKSSESVTADFTIPKVTDEAMLNDKLIGRLKIVIEEPGEGLWRFRDESKLRTSEKPQRWL